MTALPSNLLHNIDVLAARKQTVMPPSVHPDTKLPYVVEGHDLLDISFEEIPVLTASCLKVLRADIGSGKPGD